MIFVLEKSLRGGEKNAGDNFISGEIEETRTPPRWE